MSSEDDLVGVDEIVLRPHRPFRLDLTVWALRRRSRNRIDRWDADTATYSRALFVGDRAVTVEVEQIGSSEKPLLVARVVSGRRCSAHELAAIGHQMVRLLGTTVDLSGFYELADADPRIGPLKDRLLGVKPPRFPTLFEALVNAIANQQLSLEVGITLLNRFTERFGARPDQCGPVAFPEPEHVLEASPHDLVGLGFSTRKAEDLIASAHAVAAGTIDETKFAAVDRVDLTFRTSGGRYRPPLCSHCW